MSVATITAAPAAAKRPLESPPAVVNLADQPHRSTGDPRRLFAGPFRFTIGSPGDARAEYSWHKLLGEGGQGAVLLFKRARVERSPPEAYPEYLAVKAFFKHGGWLKEKALYDALEKRYAARCAAGHVRGYATALRFHPKPEPSPGAPSSSAPGARRPDVEFAAAPESEDYAETFFKRMDPNATELYVVVMENARPFDSDFSNYFDDGWHRAHCSRDSADAFKKIARDVVTAVDCLVNIDRQKRMVYADLKSDNMLIQDDPSEPLGFRVVLTDLGGLAEVDAKRPNAPRHCSMTYSFGLFPEEPLYPFNLLCDALVIFLFETLSRYLEVYLPLPEPPHTPWPRPWPPGADLAKLDAASKAAVSERAAFVSKYLLNALSEIEKGHASRSRARVSRHWFPFALLRELSGARLLLMYADGKARYVETVRTVLKYL